MIEILEKNGFYYLVSFNKNLNGVRYDLGNMLHMDYRYINQQLENNYNATWDNSMNQTPFGIYKLAIGFEKREDAKRALEWIRSIETINILGGRR